MNDSLYIAATGMHMQQKGVDTIANNLANVNTPGFKRGRVTFEDLVYRDLSGAPASLDSGSAPRLLQGSGVGLASIFKSFAAGELQKTDGPLDLAIQGDGFLEVVGADGAPAFTRGGGMMVDKDGFLASAGGLPLKPAIHIGLDAKQITIKPDGHVLVRTTDQGDALDVGRIDLVHFTDSSGLAALGANLYKTSDRSGDAIVGHPGEDGVGTLAQGFVEASNVNLVEEMVNLMVAQRAYESSVKVIQASDEMLAMSNNLRK
ncbi:MAG TPA: flagellar basal-body rod protein FlgG [Telluria sp.]|nr:flagellar basal-body rod protein FlgG [Telluria sp.]